MGADPIGFTLVMAFSLWLLRQSKLIFLQIGKNIKRIHLMVERQLNQIKIKQRRK